MMRQLGLLLLVACMTPLAFGASITKVKGSGALVVLDGEPASVGDMYFAVTGGKKKALLKILKIKGDKAIAKITKGNAAVGMTLQKAGHGSRTAIHSNGGSMGGGSGTFGFLQGRAYWGGLLGYAMDSMTATVFGSSDGANKGTVAMSGSGFSAKGLLDYDIWQQVWFRGSLGLEQFKVSGSANCGTGNAQTCDANIMYLSMDFIGRYVFAVDNFRPWLGGGVSMLFPASKSTTALSSSSVGTTSVFEIAGGVDWFVMKDLYIPVSIEYGMLPKSNDVSANWIALRFGVAVPF